MYQLEIANFAYSILNDQRPAAGGEEGLMALRVALGALESIETGQPVRLSQ
jgi:predicted dehydrogenase